MPYLIGIDIGTQGTKAGLFDTDMNLIASAFEASRLISPAPGTTWQEAEDIYGAVVHVIRRLVRESGVKSHEILAAGIDSQMAGIMGIDAGGEASTPYDSWLDTRCGQYVDEMKVRAGKRIIELTGSPATYAHGPKILWWKHKNPGAYKKTAKFVLPHAYVVGKMTGLRAEESYFDHTCIQYSGFGNNLEMEWSDELLELFDIEKDKMARIVSPFEVVGRITPEFAGVSGLAAGTPVAAGAGDTAASVFGAGMFEKDLLLDCAGTASALCSVADAYVPDTRYETLTMMRSPVDGFWFPLAYVNGGGLCIRWFRDEFTGKTPMSYDELEQGALKIEPGSEGVVFIPHFAGRVLPNNRDIRGSFIGLDWKHTVNHLYRAIMEGISYEYAYYLKVLKELYPHSRFDTMHVIGGGAKSDLFLKIKADVLGVKTASFETGDTALIGSAVIAGVGAGVFDDYREPIRKAMKIRKEFSYDIKNIRLYEPYAGAYLETIDALTAVYRSEAYKKQY